MGHSQRSRWSLPGMPLLFAAVAALQGCAGPTMSARMRIAEQQPTPAPDVGNALVVFLMPSDRVLANGVIDDSGRALGEVPPRSKLVVPVPPGPHTFIQAIYKNPGAGDFSLWGHLTCNQVSGTFEAGKVYFVEMSVFRAFTVKPGDPRLPGWAVAPSAELDASKGGPQNISSDPEWSKCVAQATDNADKARSKSDTRSIFSAQDGMTHWPQ